MRKRQIRGWYGTQNLELINGSSDLPSLQHQWSGTEFENDEQWHLFAIQWDYHHNGLKQNSQNWKTTMERDLKYPHSEQYVPSSKACSKSSRLRSRLPLTSGTERLPATGTRRRVMTAQRLWVRLLLFASVDTSPGSRRDGFCRSCPSNKNITSSQTCLR